MSGTFGRGESAAEDKYMIEVILKSLQLIYELIQRMISGKYSRVFCIPEWGDSKKSAWWCYLIPI